MSALEFVALAAIPPDVVATLVPAALLSVWVALVVGVVLGLAVAVGMDGAATGSEDASILARRRSGDDRRAAA